MRQESRYPKGNLQNARVLSTKSRQLHFPTFKGLENVFSILISQIDPQVEIEMILHSLARLGETHAEIIGFLV